MATQRPPVFFDVKGQRSRAVVALGRLGLILFVFLSIFLLVSIIATPSLPKLTLSGVRLPISSIGGRLADLLPKSKLHKKRDHRPAASTARSALRYGFFVNWDENSLTSLKHNAAALDILIPEWLDLDGPNGAIRHDDAVREKHVRSWLAKNAPHIKIMPLINNFDPSKRRWDGSNASAVLASKKARKRLAKNLLAYVEDGKFAGIVLNFKEILIDGQTDLIKFLRELSDRFHKHGLKVLVTRPFYAKNYNIADLAKVSDGVVALLYHEHSAGEAQGPLAGQGWFEKQLDFLFENVGEHKIIVAIGSYATDWAGAGKGKEISVGEAWELLEAAKGELIFQSSSLNPTFSYEVVESDQRHNVWLLDGATFFNQMAAALAMKPAGVALWRLGTEDPTVWATFGHQRVANNKTLEELKRLRAGYDVVYHGEGEILRVTDRLKFGKRRIEYDAKYNLIVDEKIIEYPRATTITRWGLRRDHVIGLTFDDGPSPAYTPAILDILEQKGVKATFFIVGSQGAENPTLLQRIYEDGHDIGNHTFTHPNLGEILSNQIALELNATQRLLGANLGIRTFLFRPPFNKDIEPHTIDQAKSLLTASALGYTTIGLRIDPLDWARPGAEEIIRRTLEHAVKGRGNIVLLHDGGGNRSQTVEALPKIIDSLRARGYRFKTVHEIMGVSRHAIMPKVPPGELYISSVNGVGFSLFWKLGSLVGVLFVVGISLGIVRLFGVSAMAVAHYLRQGRRPKHDGNTVSVSVIIPAFNEEKVICKSIDALLTSNISNFDIIVVDDGSSDQTANIVRQTYLDNDRVLVLDKPNGGKALALNFALQNCESEVVVGLDADTVFEPDALRLLLGHFVNSEVGAVAGNTQVGNRLNLITRFQALEYVTSQNMDRRAFELVNGIPVVPGAIGAFRRSALLDAGGYTNDTMAEDADLTLRLERAGWRVLYEPNAVAWTEAPADLGSFLKQRYRWMFGMLQAAVKNRGALFQPSANGVRFCTLPNIFVFQFLFVIISPIMDIVLLWSISAGIYTYVMHPTTEMPTGTWMIIFFWATFQLLEIGAAALAFAMDNRKGWWSLLPLVILQRFCYRQLIYWSALRAVTTALTGLKAEWNKLERTGEVQAPQLTAAIDPQLLRPPRNPGRLLPQGAIVDLHENYALTRLMPAKMVKRSDNDSPATASLSC